MSGIAIATQKMTKQLKGSSIRLMDTRETKPGLRLLEKYSVRVCGGHNHRYNLSDMMILDDMNVDQMEEAIAFIDGRAIMKASGNMTSANIEQYKTLGIDYISSGAITHSAGIVDLSMKNLTLTNKIQNLQEKKPLSILCAQRLSVYFILF